MLLDGASKIYTINFCVLSLLYIFVVRELHVPFDFYGGDRIKFEIK